MPLEQPLLPVISLFHSGMKKVVNILGGLLLSQQVEH